MPSKKCLARVSHKTVKQECLTRALRNSVKQGCPTRVLPQCVNSGCLTSEFAGDVTNKYCLCLSTYVSAFGFVGFIWFFFFFPECVARVPVSLGGLGVRLCSPKVAFATATVRNRSQPLAVAP